MTTHNIVTDLQLPQATIAKATGVSERTVYSWLHAAAEPHTARYERLVALRDVVNVLREDVTSRGINQWLNARSRPLAGARPVDLLAAGREDDVLDAARELIEGVYV